MTAPTLNQWDHLFLKDIGAPFTPQNVNFLNTWVGREGGMATKGYNPLFTTEPGFGGVSVNSVGVKAYPTIQQGALANATVLEGGGYNNLLNGFRNNSLNPGGNYSADLSRWSGGGYSSILGGSPVSQNSTFGPFMGQGGTQLMGQAGLWQQENAPAAAQAGIDQLFAQLGITNEQQWVSEQSKAARQEKGFQEQNLLLSEADLQQSQHQLQRQLGLAPKEQKLQEALYSQQFADMARNYQTNKEQMNAGEAAGGNFFSRGSHDNRTNLFKNYESSHHNLAIAKRQEELNYGEQIKEMREQQDTLKRMAQRYGISEQEIQSRLAQQLSNIQYGGLSSLYPLMKQIAGDQLTMSLAAGGAAPQTGAVGSANTKKKKPVPPAVKHDKRRGGVS